jgi:hypothetical protein
MSDMLQTVKTVAVLIVAVAVLVPVITGVIGAVGVISDGGTQTATFDVADGSAPIQPVAENVTQVQQSLGTALSLDGDGSVSATGLPATDSTVSLCTWAETRAPDVNQSVTHYDGRMALQYAGNRSDPHYVVTYYDQTDREVYDAAVNLTAAGLDADTPTHLCAQADGSTLTLYANGTQGESVALDGAGAVTDGGFGGFAPLSGVVEETRVFDRDLLSSERTALRQTPTAPLPGGASARLMFDTRRGVGQPFDSTPVFFTDATAAIDGGTVADGYDGQTLAEGSDYAVRDGGRTIAVLDGGRLDGAPVVFVTYDAARAGPFLAPIRAVETVGPSALILLVVGGLVIGASAVVSRLQQF